MTQILTEVEAPMRAQEIHAAVEVLRGEPVPWSSVKDCLASNVGPAGRFIRVARGRYRIVPPAIAGQAGRGSQVPDGV
ncbi:MAG TPA: hypothetical protein VFF79_03045 [Conexibacter sp.]|nr:hypothetical protein [Conexibacter sp.]